MANERDTRQRLKKQPRLRRQPSRSGRSRSSSPSSLRLPRTADRRRRRNRLPFEFPLGTLAAFFLSPRWISFFILAASIYAMNLTAARTDFYLRYIPVEGLISIPAEEVIRTSGLAGRHIFTADPRDAAESIVEIPGIEAAEVDIRWPNQINIVVEEDSPIAVWVTPEQSYWISREGELFPARIDLPGLLHIEADSLDGLIGSEDASTRLAEETEIVFGEESPNEVQEPEAAPFVQQSIGTVPEDILLGAFLLQRIQPNGTAIQRIDYDSQFGLFFEDSRGWVVYLGTGDDMRQKLAVHESIVAELNSQDVVPRYISVANIDKPYYAE